MLDLPRRADSTVALHLLDRRVDASLKEGSITLLGRYTPPDHRCCSLYDVAELPLT